MKPFTPDQQLKALTLKQPYADLMFRGKIETRNWNTDYREWVLICAGKSRYDVEKLWDMAGDNYLSIVNELLQIPHELSNHTGLAIGIGRLTDCRPMQSADEAKCFVKWRPGLKCHVYTDVQRIEPFPWIGVQGWKEVSVEVKKKLCYYNA